MLLSKVVETLEKDYPLDLALDDDIVGLVLGDLDKEIKNIGVSWALTPTVLEAAGIKESKILDQEASESKAAKKKKEEKTDLFIVHEYPFFERENPSLLALFEDPANYKRIRPIIREDLAIYVLHSNLDQAKFGTADSVAKQLNVKVTDTSIKCGRIGEVPESTLDSLVNTLKTAFVIDVVRIAGANPRKKIKRVGIHIGNALSSFEMIEKYYLKDVDVLFSYGLTKETAQYANEIGIQLVELDPVRIESTIMQWLSESFAGHPVLKELNTTYYDCDDVITYF